MRARPVQCTQMVRRFLAAAAKSPKEHGKRGSRSERSDSDGSEQRQRRRLPQMNFSWGSTCLLLHKHGLRCDVRNDVTFWMCLVCWQRPRHEVEVLHHAV